MTLLTEDESIVLTVITDAGKPLTLAEIAHGTAWPGERTFGERRVRRILQQLVDKGTIEAVSTSTTLAWLSTRTRSTR